MWGKQKGFSLVELSIVLVILGLLTGGILAGRSLIKASQLRDLSTQLTRYQTAVNTFRDKYLAIPGDMENATSFWGLAGGTTGDASDTTCQGTASTTAATCNGNGDRLIVYGAGSEYEMFRAWQHLANAGLIEGQYTGTAGAGGTSQAIIGTNVPGAKMNNVGFAMRNWNCSSAGDATGNCFAQATTQMMVGSNVTSSTSYHFRAALVPEDAWNIDSKLDDGKPGTGRLMTWAPAGTYTPYCATSSDAAAAQYDLDYTSIACSFLIRLY